MEESPKVKPTPLLWLIPIFMGLLGGILMYIAVKDEDQEKANNAILIGVKYNCVDIWLCGDHDDIYAFVHESNCQHERMSF